MSLGYSSLNEFCIQAHPAVDVPIHDVAERSRVGFAHDVGLPFNGFQHESSIEIVYDIQTKQGVSGIESVSASTSVEVGEDHVIDLEVQKPFEQFEVQINKEQL